MLAKCSVVDKEFFMKKIEPGAPTCSSALNITAPEDGSLIFPRQVVGTKNLCSEGGLSKAFKSLSSRVEYASDQDTGSKLPESLFPQAPSSLQNRVTFVEDEGDSKVASSCSLSGVFVRSRTVSDPIPIPLPKEEEPPRTPDQVEMDRALKEMTAYIDRGRGRNGSIGRNLSIDGGV